MRRSDRSARLLGATAGIVAGAWAILVFSVRQGAEVGPVVWTWIAWLSLFSVASTVILWAWIFIRMVWEVELPRTGRSIRRVLSQVHHRPDLDSQAPHLHFCMIEAKQEISPPWFRVTATETMYNIWPVWSGDEDDPTVDEIGMTNGVESSVLRPAPRVAFITFHVDQLPREGRWTIGATGKDEEFRIAHVRRATRREVRQLVGR